MGDETEEACRMRLWRSSKLRWSFIFLSILALYAFLLYIPILNIRHQLAVEHSEEDKTAQHQSAKMQLQIRKDPPPRSGRISLANTNRSPPRPHNEPLPEPDAPFQFSPASGESFYVERLLTNYDISLTEKMKCKVRKGAKPKILVSINAGHSQVNFGGCPDWNCQITNDRSQVERADAVLIAYDAAHFKSRPNQYTIYFSQESPKNSGLFLRSGIHLNMTLGFRHDSPTASPYGYTVQLAPQSYKKGPFVNETMVKGKTKGAAWFVSHCATNSNREHIVAELKKYYPVDIYGGCGQLRCPRGASCENALDTDYNFYIAFENSVCKDYNTEKLWKSGYQRTIIPIVLKRSIVEAFVPPHSFIAVDDFKTLQDMAKHLIELTNNRTAYLEYFKWREQYKVIFLDGANHDVMERPWGFCQICRLMWEEPKKYYSIDDVEEYWYNSCEPDGELADKIISATRAKA